MTTQVKVDPRDLAEMPGNENVMDDAMYRSLVEFVREYGFLQPILAWRRGDELVVIDGVHRKHAAIVLGLAEVPVEVDATITTEGEARAARIGMNRHRGELDLAAVGRTMLELSRGGWSPDELSAVGFTTREVAEMLDVTRDASAGEVLGSEAPPPPPGEDPPEDSATTGRVYSLRVQFHTREERDEAQEILEGFGALTSGQRLLEALRQYEEG